LIDAAGLGGVAAVDDRQRIELHPVLAQEAEPAHDLRVGGMASAVDPVGVMEVGRAVDTDADEEVPLPEETAPVSVEERAVGLEAVEDFFAAGVPLLEGDGTAEEIQSHEGGFASLPGEDHLGNVLRGDVPADIGLEDL